MLVSRTLDEKQRCPLCHEQVQVDQRVLTCVCDAAYHFECHSELGGCGTLGCCHNGRRLEIRVRDAQEDESLGAEAWRLLFVVCLLALALLLV